uniref:Uncharacterized protein n=1 Tax=Bactrocera dorsalis TaxID=27457 RepID=A0A034VJ49_BACDO
MWRELTAPIMDAKRPTPTPPPGPGPDTPEPPLLSADDVTAPAPPPPSATFNEDTTAPHTVDWTVRHSARVFSGQLDSCSFSSLNRSKIYSLKEQILKYYFVYCSCDFEQCQLNII